MIRGTVPATAGVIEESPHGEGMAESMGPRQVLSAPVAGRLPPTHA